MGPTQILNNQDYMKLLSYITLLITLMFCNYPVLGWTSSQDGSTSRQQFSDNESLATFNALANKAHHEGYVQVLVALKETFNGEGLSKNQIQEYAQQKSIEDQQNALLVEVPVRKRYSHLPFMALSANETELQRLRASPLVAEIFEDHANFPLFHEFSIAKIGADAGWGLGYTGAGQTIAIFDNGIDKYHPLLLNKVVFEACFSTRNPDRKITPLCRKGRTVGKGINSATVRCGFLDFACVHGTFVAGLAAGNSLTPDYVGSGAAPQASILAVKVVSLIKNRAVCAPATQCQVFFDSDMLRGLNLIYSLRRKLNISSVNLSFGANVTSRYCKTTPIRRMVAKLRAANIATIAASGNDGSGNSLTSPGCIPGVISVGATNIFDAIWPYSNSAPSLSLLAPGDDGGLNPIDGTFSRRISLPMPGVVPPGYELGAVGTSLSSAFVSGAWAALKSHKPSATVNEILAALVNSGVPIYDPRNGLVRSRIQVNQAHAALGP
jgi:subtilisin